jgi:hypothetical protein
MKIVKLVVTDEDGKEHTYEGTGFISPPSRKTATGTPVKPIEQKNSVMAEISWPV